MVTLWQWWSSRRGSRWRGPCRPDAAPFGEALVAGDDHGAALTFSGDQLEGMSVGLTAIAKKWPWYSAHDTDLGAHVAQSERHRRACAVRRLAFWAAGEACLMGGDHLRDQYLGRRYAGSASRRTPIAQSETAIRDGMRRYRHRVLKLSSSYRNPMVKHEPELHKSETATFANGWLTKMIKARLHLQQSGPD